MVLDDKTLQKFYHNSSNMLSIPFRDNLDCKIGNSLSWTISEKFMTKYISDYNLSQNLSIWTIKQAKIIVDRQSERHQTIISKWSETVHHPITLFLKISAESETRITVQNSSIETNWVRFVNNYFCDERTLRHRVIECIVYWHNR